MGLQGGKSGLDFWATDRPSISGNTCPTTALAAILTVSTLSLSRYLDLSHSCATTLLGAVLSTFEQGAVLI